MSKFVLVALALGLIIGCAGNRKTNTTDLPLKAEKQTEIAHKSVSKPADVDQMKWVLSEMKGFNFSDIKYDAGKPSLKLDVAKLATNGYTGCNSFGGNFEIKNDSIKFGMMMSTKKYCFDVPEPEFLNLLQNADTYEVKNNVLLLKTNGSVVLSFVKELE